MAPPELPKTFDPHAAAERYYQGWEDGGYFTADPDAPGEPYCIVIPPPNVTGSLHMGHALNNTLQDVLIRYKRMDGYNTLWLPGTDHAGIATQWVVERQLRAAVVGAEFHQVHTLRRPARSTSFLVETEKALAVQEDLQDEEGVSGGPLDLSGISAHSEGGAADTSWGAGSQRSAASPVLAAALEADVERELCLPQNSPRPPFRAPLHYPPTAPQC